MRVSLWPAYSQDHKLRRQNALSFLVRYRTNYLCELHSFRSTRDFILFRITFLWSLRFFLEARSFFYDAREVFKKRAVFSTKRAKFFGSAQFFLRSAHFFTKRVKFSGKHAVFYKARAVSLLGHRKNGPKIRVGLRETEFL